MKLVGYSLFVAGVIASSCFAARAVSPEGTGPEGKVTPKDRIGAWASVAGVPFGVGVAFMVAGGVIARRRRRGGDVRGGEHVGGAPEGAVDHALEGEGSRPKIASLKHRSPRVLIKTIHSKLEEISSNQADSDKVFAILDDIIENDVADFLEQRTELIDELGLGKFAEMIGHFAMMERNVARAWSAITDGVEGEVAGCIERAEFGIKKAGEALD